MKEDEFDYLKFTQSSEGYKSSQPAPSLGPAGPGPGELGLVSAVLLQHREGEPGPLLAPPEPSRTVQQAKVFLKLTMPV